MKHMVLAVIGLALTGCATKVAGLKQSDTFTFPAVVGGKMAIGGVTSATANLDEGKRSSYATLLRNSILEERKEFNVEPVGTVINGTGANYARLMEEYRTTGSLSDQSLGLLREKLPRTRYVAFARLENDDVLNDRSETQQTDKKGRPIEGSGKVIAKSERNVTAAIVVYDLKENNAAWTGSVTKSLTNTQQYNRLQELGVVQLVKAIKGDGDASMDQKYPFPAAPETHKVLAKVFEGFGENLPKAD